MSCSIQMERRLHSPGLSDGSLGLELVRFGSGGHDVLTIGDRDSSTTVNVLGRDVLVVVKSVLGLNHDSIGASRSSGVDGEDRFQLGIWGVVSGSVGGRSHRR